MKKLAYTIFYDTGEWAWVKDAEDETMYVGSCISYGSEWAGNHPVSQSFLDFTRTWLMSLAKISCQSLDNDQFDWQLAHKQGLEVARRLKIELGDQADVRYVKIADDPSRHLEFAFEVLSNGNIEPIHRLLWCPV